MKYVVFSLFKIKIILHFNIFYLKNDFFLYLTIFILKYLKFMEKNLYYCRPRISAHALPTRWRARFFYFEK